MNTGGKHSDDPTGKSDKTKSAPKPARDQVAKKVYDPMKEKAVAAEMASRSALPSPSLKHLEH